MPYRRHPDASNEKYRCDIGGFPSGYLFMRIVRIEGRWYVNVIVLYNEHIWTISITLTSKTTLVLFHSIILLWYRWAHLGYSASHNLVLVKSKIWGVEFPRWYGGKCYIRFHLICAFIYILVLISQERESKLYFSPTSSIHHELYV